MKPDTVILRSVLFVLSILFSRLESSASEWRTIELAARPIGIAENHGILWVCGTNEFIAASTDGGKTWTTKHSAAKGRILLAVGFANERFGYAAGTGNAILITKDGGNSWNEVEAPGPVVYDISFADETHGLIHSQQAIYATSDGGASWKQVPLNLAGGALQGFSRVLTVLALDGKHMAIVLQGKSIGERLVVTKDGGLTWKLAETPGTIGGLLAHDGEFWLTGSKLIEKQKQGGHSVPLVMHSPDAEHWTHVAWWSSDGFLACNAQGCLYRDGVGVRIPAARQARFWTFARGDVITVKWAVARNQICSVGKVLKCTEAATTNVIPPPPPPPPGDMAVLNILGTQIIAPSLIDVPALDAPSNFAQLCLYCDYESVVFTRNYQGQTNVQLKISVGQNGLVEKVEVKSATALEIGERTAAAARNWMFVPSMGTRERVAHPFAIEVTVKVMAVKAPGGGI